MVRFCLRKYTYSGKTTGYIPIYDWTQAIPSLSYAGNTYNINLQMYNSPVRLVPVPLNEQVCYVHFANSPILQQKIKFTSCKGSFDMVLNF